MTDKKEQPVSEFSFEQTTTDMHKTNTIKMTLKGPSDPEKIAELADAWLRNNGFLEEKER